MPRDPISDREREQLEEIRQIYIRRFGYDPDTGIKNKIEHKRWLAEQPWYRRAWIWLNESL